MVWDKYGDLRAEAVTRRHKPLSYREFKYGVTETQIENLQAKIYNGKAQEPTHTSYKGSRWHCRSLWFSYPKQDKQTNKRGDEMITEYWRRKA
jgi:hypothetical protein